MVEYRLAGDPTFRQEVAQRLRAFLAMATGSDLEWWDTASGDTYVVSSAGITWYEWGSTDTATEDIATPKEEAPDAPMQRTRISSTGSRDRGRTPITAMLQRI